MKKRILFAISNSFLLLVMHAQPMIVNIEGTVQNNAEISILGANFGVDGPNILIYDEFNGKSGDTVALEANIGSWSGMNQYYPSIYVQDEKENISALLVDGNNMRQLNINFDPVQEIYLTYRVRIPEGYNFPHTDSPETFPEGSQWKLSWLMDGSRGYMGNDDLVIPTWGNGTYFMIGGNDNAFQLPAGRPGTENNWFSFLYWNRFSTYMKSGENPTENAGIVWAQGMSKEFGQCVFYSDEKILFDGDDSADGYEFEDDDISQWNRFNLPGWFRDGGTNVRAIYDNVYIATGANARARVEIGDQASYDACKDLHIQTPSDWTDNKVELRLNYPECSSEDTLYLYVVDASGEVNEEGYPIVICDQIVSTQELRIHEFLNEDFVVYPLPGDDLINFYLGDFLKDKVEITVFNKTGELVNKVTRKFPESVISLNFIDLSSGIYFFQVKISSDKNVYLKKGKIMVLH